MHLLMNKNPFIEIYLFLLSIDQRLWRVLSVLINRIIDCGERTVITKL